MKRSARLALVWQSLRTAGDDFSSVASTTSLDTTQTYRKGAVLRNLFLLFQPLLACENIYLLQMLLLAWTSIFVWFSSFQAVYGLPSKESTESLYVRKCICTLCPLYLYLLNSFHFQLTVAAQCYCCPVKEATERQQATTSRLLGLDHQPCCQLDIFGSQVCVVTQVKR